MLVQHKFSIFEGKQLSKEVCFSTPKNANDREREREREREKSSSLWQAKVTGDLINDFWAKISF